MFINFGYFGSYFGRLKVAAATAAITEVAFFFDSLAAAAGVGISFEGFITVGASGQPKAGAS